MSNARIRFILFFTALPSLGLVLLLPHFHYAAFFLICAGASGIASIELANIFKHRGIPVSKPVAFFLGVLGPTLVFGESHGILTSSLIPPLYIAVLMFLYASEIVKKSLAEFTHSLPRMAAYTLLALYPGFFSSYAMRLTQLEEGGILVLIFLLASFLNDSSAWAFGMLFGNNNRNILIVSPNKSLVGFVCGFLSSILVLMVGTHFFPQILPFSYLTSLLFGSIIGLTTMIGDLIESVMKRSAAVKDSSSLIPGRGGLLDSIDSPLFNAPIFYYLYLWFQGKY